MIFNIKHIIFLSLILLLCNCASQKSKIKESDKYFQKSLDLFERQKYLKAKDRFQNIIDTYPGTELGVDALYYLAFCEYELKDFEESKQSFKVYKRYSQDILKVQSASFMISLCLFELTLDYPNDQTETYNALESFQLFIEDYPGSKFNSEAMDKIKNLRTKLALKDYEVAKLYIKSEQYDSARQYLNELLQKYYDIKYSDDAHIAHILIYLISEDQDGAEKYLEKNKNKFHSENTYSDARNIIDNSNKKITIKNIYFLDYFNRLL
ncbi:MAG: hypothetical protein CMG00_04535 [Candidatus Marinimicrobia bacterium]|nr:hypothetical protein [Candidatus Neomarinimicrobiota bacterium]|tara:strand:- start:4203 stop:5000 length:798 start_codon:yes stop_codon:yes gene_type:complete